MHINFDYLLNNMEMRSAVADKQTHKACRRHATREAPSFSLTDLNTAW